ncbi:hypothetical protein VHEMI10294 [[Torrubiella] hemipterigena]|uniref:Pyoverdine/dityrosine biosynthesis protein n=1 Tax=[Torrubiella] hemipterigena TaxID=1531966 RepID=A0A0A1TT29_9HYPO|nr:hypothetical protein VHEMI10294 [[Torrubiella] hemipterigena]
MSCIGKKYTWAITRLTLLGVADVIGVTDQDTWEYGQELRAIIAEKKLHHVVFVHPQTLLGMVPASEMTREKYMETADECRSMLEAQYGSTIKEIEALITADRDTNSTYCGMVKFLETEISAALVGKSYKERKRLQKDTAKKMMQRSEAFTMAIRSLRPMDVRLSMHPSSGAAKLSISLIPCPKGFFQRSPWHSCVAIDAQGGYHCVHSEDVKMTHDLVYKNGRPYFYMVKESVAEEAPAEGSFQAPLHVEVAKEASFMAPMSPKATVK